MIRPTEADRPSFRIAEQSPWSDPRSYRPDPIEMLRERLREEQDDLWLLPTLLGVAVLVIGVVFYVATGVLS